MLSRKKRGGFGAGAMFGITGGLRFATRRCSKILEFFSRQLAQEPIKKQKNRDAARQMPVFPRSKIFSKK
jgi:hypothetical protein